MRNGMGKGKERGISRGEEFREERSPADSACEIIEIDFDFV